MRSRTYGLAALTCVVAGVVLLTAAGPALGTSRHPVHPTWAAGPSPFAGTTSKASPRPFTTSYPAGTIALGPPGNAPGPLAFDPQTGDLYVGESPHTIAIVNASTGNLVGDLTVASTPVAIVFNPFDGDLYVPLAADGIGHTNVSIVDPFAETVVTNVAVGPAPTAATLDSTTGEVFVSVNAGTQIVGILPTHVVAGVFAAGPSNPVVGLTYDATSHTLIAVGGNVTISSNLTAYTPSNGSVLGAHALTGRSIGVVTDPGTGNEFAVSFFGAMFVTGVSTPGMNTVGVLRIPDGASTARGTPAFDAALNRILVPEAQGIDVVNASSLGVLSNVALGQGVASVAVVNFTGTAWASYAPYDLLEQFAPSNGSPLSKTVVGGVPGQGTFDSTTGILWVPEVDANTVEGIQPTTHTVAATYAVGSAPVAAAYDPGSDRLFVADAGSPAVTVLTAAGGGTLKTIPLPYTPDAIVDDPLYGTVYVALNGAASNATVPGEIIAINTTSLNDTPLEPIVLGPGGPGVPTAMAVDDVTGGLYIAVRPSPGSTATDGWVSEYSELLGRVVVNVSVPSSDPFGIAVDDVTAQVFVVWPDAIVALAAVNLGTTWTDSFLPSLPGLSGASLVCDPQANSVFAGNSNLQVSVFNATTGSQLQTLQLSSAPGSAFYSPASAEVYVAALDPDSVAYVHTTAPTPVTAIFNAATLPFGKIWSVQLGQVASSSSNGPNLSLHAPPAAYRFAVTPPALSLLTPTSGVVVLASGTVTVLLTYNGSEPARSHPTGPSGPLAPLFSLLALYVIGGLGLAALVSGLVMAYFLNRRRREERIEGEFFEVPPQ